MVLIMLWASQMVMALSITTISNPVLTAMILLLFSVIGFYMIWLMTNFCWAPTLMTLLFTGGVLIAFMILSSLKPNEAMAKSKLTLVGAGLLAMAYGCSNTNLKMIFTLNMVEYKEAMTENANLFFLTVLILTYFLGFIQMISMSKLSLRLAQCQNQMIL